MKISFKADQKTPSPDEGEGCNRPLPSPARGRGVGGEGSGFNEYPLTLTLTLSSLAGGEGIERLRRGVGVRNQPDNPGLYDQMRNR